MISRLRREMQMARLPKHTESSASIRTDATPWLASPKAGAATGPPPTIATAWRLASAPSVKAGSLAS